MNKVEVFKQELSLIEDENLRYLVMYTLTKAPDYFFVMPASTTGKYHPKYALGKGGLVRHTKAAVKIAYDLLGLEQYLSLSVFSDEIISALILHDSVKKGINGGNYTASDHPLQAVALFRRCNDEFKTGIPINQIETICGLIASHMGQWNTDYITKKEILPKPDTKLKEFVHMCDYLASRKYLEVDLEG